MAMAMACVFLASNTEMNFGLLSTWAFAWSAPLVSSFFASNLDSRSFSKSGVSFSSSLPNSVHRTPSLSSLSRSLSQKKALSGTEGLLTSGFLGRAGTGAKGTPAPTGGAGMPEPPIGGGGGGGRPRLLGGGGGASFVSLDGGGGGGGSPSPPVPVPIAGGGGGGGRLVVPVGTFGGAGGGGRSSGADGVLDV